MDAFVDALAHVIARALTPLVNVAVSHHRLFWVYLGSAFVLAFLVYRAMRRRTVVDGAEGAGAEGATGDAETRGTFLTYCFPKAVYGHKSAVVDYKFYLVTTVLRAFGLLPLLTSPIIAFSVLAGLEGLFGPSLGVTPGPLASLAYTLVLLIAFDAGQFWSHYLLHRFPFLWEFHKVHHSALVLTPVTAFRFHPVDNLVVSCCVALFVGCTVGVGLWIFGGGVVVEIVVGGLNIGIFLFYLLGYHLRHSHVWLTYPRWMSWLLMSPAGHQLHHSKHPRHFNRNLGFMFSFWDRWAGTYHAPSHADLPVEYGIGGGEDEDYDRVSSLYFVPFSKAARRIARRARTA